MAMFARRALQGMLDHLAGHLSIEARRKIAHELDQQSGSALGFEWETALLFGLSHLGKIEYEKSAAEGTRPDIVFAEDSETAMRFTADIATVSDDGLDEQNPAMRFSTTLTRLKHKFGLPGAAHYVIKGEEFGRHYRDRKLRLKLPPASKIDAMLKKHVVPMFERIRKEKLATASVAINEPGVELTIQYDAKQRYGGGSYPSYTAAYSRTRNPVYMRLEEKRKQFKKSGGTGVFGIFLCDGGSTLLKNTQGHFAAASIDQVIHEFFRKTTSVSFVVTLVVPPSTAAPFAVVVERLRMVGQVFVNPRAKNPVDAGALLEVINRALSYVPAPVATARDALDWIANGDANEGKPIQRVIYGGSMIKVSARKIQEVLAGRMTPEQFFGEFSSPHDQFDNPFGRALNQGQTIQSVALTRTPEADDDLLEFHFGADAAIRKFAVND
jgi:hypothetical protein